MKNTKKQTLLTKLLQDYGERIKELNCLYGISKLIEEKNNINEVLQGIATVIPSAWQYPEISCSRIIFREHKFSSTNFKETVWKQTADIFVHGEKSGVIEVYYLEERPKKHEGPFVKNERNLLDSIAERLGRVIERFDAEEELNKYRGHLEELVKWRTAELQKALDHVKTLKSLLPICSSCNEIRSNEEYWQAVERYVREHPEAEFTHGFCLACEKKLHNR